MHAWPQLSLPPYLYIHMPMLAKSYGCGVLLFLTVCVCACVRACVRVVHVLGEVLL